MEYNRHPIKSSIDEYISQLDPEILGILNTLRQVIKEAAPLAEERMSYQTPSFFLKGNLVHLAALKTI